ncbi:MAG: site-2 protease family protein [Acidobacteria bacterium]|nr:MAG: site-2 protease family protein [Acidobacteriota bacterium]PYV64504.1 MAG: site-2 protease family protein [Acidobacteriota bacterium]PYV73498.1 MAG: site-2 protease family protein [Acidobacteriota bacterium]
MSSHNSPEIYVPAEVYSPDTESIVYYSSRTRPRYWLHGFLLLLTIFTTLIVGSRLQWEFLNGLPPFFDNNIFPLKWALQGRHLLLGIPFSLTLMLILLAHEMGHYVYCVKYRVAATLPFFIPFPTLFGTFGAFIRIRSPLGSRAALFDIGIAGPIAGFAVALPVLIMSLGLSHVAPAGAAPPDIQFGYPVVFRFVQQVLVASGHAHEIASVPLSRLYLHPVAIAAWVGMFATSLNLLPGGQLDGGHIVFSISPRAHKTVSNLTILALIPMAVYFWAGWLLWAVLLRLSGTRHPAVPLWPEITRGRRALAIFAVIMLTLTLTPTPIASQSLFELPQQWRASR